MAIITNGLIGYWHALQGVSGTTWNNIAPGTSSSYAMTISGTGSHAVDATNGMLFDGTDDYAETTAFDTTPTSFTIEYWIYPTDLNTKSPVSAWAGGTATTQWNCLLGNTGTSTFTSSAATVASLQMTSHAVNTLIHDVFTFDASTVGAIGYFNGIQQSSGTFSSAAAMYTVLRIGARRAGAGVGSFFKGNIMAVRIYNRVLTATEITQNYQNGTAVGLTTTPSPGTTYTSSLTETQTLTDNLYSMVFTKTLSDSLLSTDVIVKKISPTVKEDTFSASDSLVTRSGHVLSLNDSISLLDSESLRSFHIVSDSIVLSDSMNSFLAGRTISVSDSILINDTTSKRTYRSITDGVTFTDWIGKAYLKQINDSVNIIDSIIQSKGKAFTLTDSVGVFDNSLSKKFVKNLILSDNISILDNKSKSLNRIMIDALTSSETLSTHGTLSNLLNDTIFTTDSVAAKLLTGGQIVSHVKLNGSHVIIVNLYGTHVVVQRLSGTHVLVQKLRGEIL